MKNTTGNKGGVGSGNLVLNTNIQPNKMGYSVLPLRGSVNESIQLNYVRQDGITKLYVNGILMSQDAKNYVTTDTGIDISRLRKWLDGNSMFSSSAIEKIVDGTTPPSSTFKANKLSKAVISAKASANIASAVEAHILRSYCPWAVAPRADNKENSEHYKLRELLLKIIHHNDDSRGWIEASKALEISYGKYYRSHSKSWQGSWS